MPAPEYRTLSTKSRFFSHKALSLARWLTLLGTCTAPLLAQAQNCPTGDNTDDQYILGEVDGTASAMHWPTGLVWKRCSEGQTWNTGTQTCEGTAETRRWNEWMDEYMPRSFAGQDAWWETVESYTPNPSAGPQNVDRVRDGHWRMAYRYELRKITEGCNNNPKVNRMVFPDNPSSHFWSGSPLAGNSGSVWIVNFNFGSTYLSYRSDDHHARLVRGGQSFAALTSPSAQTVSAGDSATFPAFTLAPSVPAGEAWGGARISGDGNPEFQLNGTGGWVQEAIVKSGDQITVRFNAPDSGSRTVTFTLRSGQTTGTSDNASNAGDEATALQETSASFSVNVAPVAGVCGTADGVATLAAPSANLCSTGTASAVDGSATAFTWTCLGQHGGADSGQCSAPRQYEVTPSAGANGSIAPSSVQLVTAGQTANFAVTPAANYCSAISGTCPAGSWSGNSYTTGSIMASCTVTANFTGRTAMTLPLPAGPHSGETLDLTVTGSEWHIDTAQSLTAASLATLPPRVTLPHGAVSLRLTDGTPGSNATVVLTYPQDLPAGTRYYKYGPTADNPTDHWYAYPGAVISGNTITLTLTDGGAGDSDLSVNGIIDDPGGPAWITQDVAPIPTLPQWAMMLLAGIMGMLALSKVQRVRST
jgi:hypothetical protein